MAIRPYRKVLTKERELQQLQDAVEVPLRDIIGRQILDGNLIENVRLLSASDNLVAHLLGRAYRGYIVVKRDAAASIYDDTSPLPQSYLNLVTSADVTVSLWVF